MTIIYDAENVNNIEWISNNCLKVSVHDKRLETCKHGYSIAEPHNFDATPVLGKQFMRLRLRHIFLGLYIAKFKKITNFDADPVLAREMMRLRPGNTAPKD
jgi:hypothetical protein